jgi:Calpain family cysteine protease
MSVSTNNGNPFLDDYARQINALEANPNATSEYDAGLEAQFAAVKAQILGSQGAQTPSAASTPNPLAPSIDPLLHFPMPQSGSIPPTASAIASLGDPNMEPQFNVPGATGTMGTPSNFNLFPDGGPSPHDIDQHVVGDCFLDATLGSLAAQNPEFVKNMVQANPDGTYTVHLFDPNGNRVDVTVNNQVPLDSNGNLVGVGGPNNQANWASIVEKAFAKYNDVYHVTGNPGESGYAALNDGGSNNNFYEALTGVTATSIPNSSFTTPAQQNALGLKMQQAINNGQTVFTGSPKDQTLPNGVQILGPHQYSVVDVNQDANGNWYVDVRNPWGLTPMASNPLSTAGDGVIRMSMSEYCQYMDLTTIGDKSIGSPTNNNWQPPGGPIEADMNPMSV